MTNVLESLAERVLKVIFKDTEDQKLKVKFSMRKCRLTNIALNEELFYDIFALPIEIKKANCHSATFELPHFNKYKSEPFRILIDQVQVEAKEIKELPERTVKKKSQLNKLMKNLALGGGSGAPFKNTRAALVRRVLDGMRIEIGSINMKLGLMEDSNLSKQLGTEGGEAVVSLNVGMVTSYATNREWKAQNLKTLRKENKDGRLYHVFRNTSFFAQMQFKGQGSDRETHLFDMPVEVKTHMRRRRNYHDALSMKSSIKLDDFGLKLSWQECISMINTLDGLVKFGARSQAILMSQLKEAEANSKKSKSSSNKQGASVDSASAVVTEEVDEMSASAAAEASGTAAPKLNKKQKAKAKAKKAKNRVKRFFKTSSKSKAEPLDTSAPNRNDAVEGPNEANLEEGAAAAADSSDDEEELAEKVQEEQVENAKFADAEESDLLKGVTTFKESVLGVHDRMIFGAAAEMEVIFPRLELLLDISENIKDDNIHLMRVVMEKMNFGGKRRYEDQQDGSQHLWLLTDVILGHLQIMYDRIARGGAGESVSQTIFGPSSGDYVEGCEPLANISTEALQIIPVSDIFNPFSGKLGLLKYKFALREKVVAGVHFDLLLSFANELFPIIMNLATTVGDLRSQDDKKKVRDDVDASEGTRRLAEVLREIPSIDMDLHIPGVEVMFYPLGKHLKARMPQFSKMEPYRLRMSMGPILGCSKDPERFVAEVYDTATQFSDLSQLSQEAPGDGGSRKWIFGSQPNGVLLEGSKSGYVHRMEYTISNAMLESARYPTEDCDEWDIIYKGAELRMNELVTKASHQYIEAHIEYPRLHMQLTKSQYKYIRRDLLPSVLQLRDDYLLALYQELRQNLGQNPPWMSVFYSAPGMNVSFTDDFSVDASRKSLVDFSMNDIRMSSSMSTYGSAMHYAAKDYCMAPGEAVAGYDDVLPAYALPAGNDSPSFLYLTYEGYIFPELSPLMLKPGFSGEPHSLAEYAKMVGVEVDNEPRASLQVLRPRHRAEATLVNTVLQFSKKQLEASEKIFTSDGIELADGIEYALTYRNCVFGGYPGKFIDCPDMLVRCGTVRRSMLGDDGNDGQRAGVWMYFESDAQPAAGRKENDESQVSKVSVILDKDRTNPVCHGDSGKDPIAALTQIMYTVGESAAVSAALKD